MSIRVSKPAINLREKLTELDTPPIGAHGSELMNSSSVKESFDLVKAGRKNMIINGDFQIAQRNTTKSGINNSWDWAKSTVDHWRLAVSSGGGTWTSSQDTDVPIGQGFRYSWKLDCTTADTAVDAGDYMILEHQIEANTMAHLGWGTAGAKPATLSFWVKAGVVGDCNAMLYGDNFNTTRIVNQNFTINEANKWEYKTMTFPAHGPENSFTIDNTVGVRIWLWFKAGATWTAGAGTRNYWRNNASNQQGTGTTINIADSTSNNLWITGVQFEEGYNATPFDYKTHYEQLRDCQRYFAVWPPRSGGIPAWPVYTGSAQASAHCWIPYNMRTVPTPTDKGTGTSTTTGHVYNNNGLSVTTRYANGSSPTLTCGGDSINGNYGINMHFGSYGSGGHEADTASWNGTSPGIFLDSEL